MDKADLDPFAWYHQLMDREADVVLARSLSTRWATVNARELEELQGRDLEEKLEAVEMLMLSIDDFGWRAQLDDDSPVRERWNRLRQVLGRSRDTHR